MTAQTLAARNELSVSSPLPEAIGGGLATARRLIYRDYLANLQQFGVFCPDGEHSFDPDVAVRVFKLSRLVQENRADTLESATAVYTALGAAGYAVFLLLRCDGRGEHSLYIGTRCLPEGRGGDAAGKLLDKSFKGHFPGSSLEKLNNVQTRELLDFVQPVRSSPSTCVTAVTGIPSLSTDERDNFTQGLERFIDAAGQHPYMALILAEPVSPQTLHQIQAGYEETASHLAPLQSTQLAYGVQDSFAVSETIGRNFSTSIGASLGRTMTEGNTETTGDSWGVSGGVGTPLPFTPFLSANYSKNKSSSYSKSQSDSTTTTESISEGSSDSRGETETTGSSRQITLTVQDKTVEKLLNKIDHHLQRIDEARAYGGWNTAAYFIGPDTETAQSLSSLFLGLMRGGDSGAEDFAITCWNHKRQQHRDNVLAWLKRLTHPRLQPDFSEGVHISHISPATLVSGREMALQLSLPRRSTEATTVMDVPVFGRRRQLLDQGSQQTPSRSLYLGTLRHLWRDDSHQNIELDLDKLAAHALVTGTTGVGKTTTIMSLLARAHRMGVPFMVIEPAKGEYKQLQGLGTTAHPVRYCVAGRSGPNALRLNPLVFPDGIELADHIDRVCTVFNAAFPMYAAMPQILEEAVYRAYEELGWDSISSRSIRGRIFPTLGRVAELIPEIVRNLGFSEQVSSDYVGALTTRLRALCRGALGKTLLCHQNEETAWEDLLTNSSIIDLSSMGSPEKRALLMGVLFMRLYETRLSSGVPNNGKLRHLMILEEAHVLLKRTATEQSQEGSNPRGLAVEAFANALAEMRGYGQGFIIADQSASALDDCVLRNTNIKIVMRAPFEVDRIALGGALALSEEQAKQLARLENHTAVVSQSDWLEPLLCHIKPEEIPSANISLAPEVSGKERRIRTDLLWTLFADRLHLPQELPEIDVEAAAFALGATKRQAVDLARDCARPLPRTSQTLERHIRTILPDVGGASLRFLSAQACFNHIMATLEEQTYFVADDIGMVVAAEIINVTRMVEPQQLRKCIEQIQGRYLP
ncbi:FtsK/SpoIIIE domain-containing protein [Azospirillum picis]|uniref:FtsK domain-containing protein n=1 Tax=Azospirillum picis TaxID=488438 RepID=A0ABU0MI47_9PROT|nr:FtsK/SpoIIIE domain-containing protein [Azospirillum picis]MBP2299235.1 hypothetical protein [Azospirillum picis]MDQ0533127.1 hypothetical protein [Azospirillum picis]